MATNQKQQTEVDKKNMPLVSVVTPVHNGAKYLSECIRSVMDQTYRNWEYIILNNCSTDNTLEIAEKHAAEDERIRIYNTDTLLPIMENWNFSLSKISPESKYCKVVHADDMLFSPCLEQMVSRAVAHPTAGVIGSYGLWGNRVVCDGLPLSDEFLSGKELCRLTLQNQVNCFWSPSSLLIRSDLIRKRPHFYNEKHIHADVEACYEILKESDFGFVHQVLTFIRRHEDSVTSAVAAPYNRTILWNLDLFLTFGPVYLSRDEYETHLKLKTRKYYKFLADSLFRLREKKFWRYHRDSCEEMKFQWRYSRLMYFALYKMIAFPVKTCSMVFKSAKELAFR